MSGVFDDQVRRLAKRTLGVVVHYGDFALTANCLRSIDESTVHPALVALVDNGPESIRHVDLERFTVPIRMITPGRNIGFAAAVNRAVSRAPEFDLIWLLNNDAVATPKAFEELLASAARVNAPALISSRVVYQHSGRTWFERGRFYPWRLESKHISVTQPQFPEDRDVARPSAFQIPYLSGCSLLVPAAIAAPTGLLDPRFFLYGEDIDLALRAQRRGWPLVLSRASLVLHRPSSGATSFERERMLAESAARIVRREFPLLLGVAIWMGVALGVLRSILDRDPARVRARLRGYRESVVNHPLSRR